MHIEPSYPRNPIYNSLKNSAELSDADIAAIQAEPRTMTDLFLARKYGVNKTVIQWLRTRNRVALAR